MKKKSKAVKKAQHYVTPNESESRAADEVIAAPPKKKNGAKNAATKEGDENRIWTADEIGSLLTIMETMLEEFIYITK
jgi:hypothetical protein